MNYKNVARGIKTVSFMAAIACLAACSDQGDDIEGFGAEEFRSSTSDTAQFCADHGGKKIALSNDYSSDLIAVDGSRDIVPGLDADDVLLTVNCTTIAGDDYLYLSISDGGSMSTQSASGGGHMPIIVTDGPPDMGGEMWQVTEMGVGSYTFSQPDGRVLAINNGDVTTGPATSAAATWTVADVVTETTASFCTSYDGQILAFTSQENRGLAGMPSIGGYHVESILGLSGSAGDWVLDCAADSSYARMWNMQSDGALAVTSAGVFADPNADAELVDARFTVQTHADGTVSLANAAGAGTLDISGVLVVAGTANIATSQRWYVAAQ